MLSSCSSQYLPWGEEKAPKKSEASQATKNLTPEQKALIAKEKQAASNSNKVKCQDAKMDLVEAEGANNLSQKSMATKRIRQYCVNQ